MNDTSQDTSTYVGAIVERGGPDRAVGSAVGSLAQIRPTAQPSAPVARAAVEGARGRDVVAWGRSGTICELVLFGVGAAIVARRFGHSGRSLTPRALTAILALATTICLASVITSVIAAVVVAAQAPNELDSFRAAEQAIAKLTTEKEDLERLKGSSDTATKDFERCKAQHPGKAGGAYGGPGLGRSPEYEIWTLVCKPPARPGAALGLAADVSFGMALAGVNPIDGALAENAKLAAETTARMDALRASRLASTGEVAWSAVAPLVLGALALALIRRRQESGAVDEDARRDRRPLFVAVLASGAGALGGVVAALLLVVTRALPGTSRVAQTLPPTLSVVVAALLGVVTFEAFIAGRRIKKLSTHAGS